MVRFNGFEKTLDLSVWKELCEKYGKPQQICRGEYFVHNGEVLDKVGWIVSGVFKHTLMVSDGKDKTVGFTFSDTLLANYESVMYSKEIRTDIIALEDSELLVAPAKAMRDKLLGDPILHTQFIQSLFDQLYECFLDFYRYSPEQRYKKLLECYPQISNIVPYGDIASYLNISRRQLQRIRYNMDSQKSER